MPSQTSPHPRAAGASPTIRFVAGFESTYLPLYDLDIAETTNHDRHWKQDLTGLKGQVQHARYPLRWHRIEAERGRYDWQSTDAVLAHLQVLGVSPIVDLVHHTSYPAWLDDGLRDRRFRPAFVDFASAVADRYPWLEAYTLLNEPFSTLHFAGHESLWPPYDSGLEGMARLVSNVLPALSEAASIWREALPHAKHVWVDTCEHHACAPGTAESHVAMANDRRHVLLDLALGHALDLDRPYLGALIRAGAEAALTMPPLQVDILGLDYYAFHEWWYDASGGRAPSPQPLGFAAIAQQYWERYGVDVMLSETNLRGLPSDRVSWLRYVMEQYELAVARGVPLRGLCWYPHIDSADWDSLLARPAGRTDPVGVMGVVAGDRQATIFTAAWHAAAAGAGSAEIPPYRFQSPAAEQLAGFLPQMAHWDWIDPPASLAPAPIVIPNPEEISVPTQNDLSGERLRPAPLVSEPSLPLAPDLMVVSHLRWTWVWQRPQHLVSRFARRRAADGALTWYVEEPTWGIVAQPTLRTEQHDGVVRVWLELPRDPRQPDAIGFDAPGAERYPALVADLLAAEGRPPQPDVLLYTPMAFHFAEAMKPTRLVYDVMDDLSSFKDAPQGLRLRQRRLLAEADVVFTGGRSLHRSTLVHRSTDCHLFPSGVETAHYAVARKLRRPHRVKVAGYVGVIDERLDLDLIAGVAAALPDWDVQIVGPVAKIDPDSLPQAANLAYPGQVAYAELPRVMAGFDVALMPFALNEATRSISPTKTLEYLAAGLPVVATRVPDVVADYSGTVYLADNAAEFAEGCRQVLRESAAERDQRIRKITQRHEWDYIAAEMYELIRPEVAARPATYTEEASA